MRRLLPVSLLAILLASTRIVAQDVQCFSDEFNGNQLDPTKWDVFKGAPTIANGKLTLAGGTTRADIQSKQSFMFGTLTVVIESSSWKPANQTTDSSFGFEVFNGACHYGVVLVANGNLGLLRPDPVNGVCTGDPKFQEYVRIPDWDAIRAAGRIVLTLTWLPNEVRMRVSDGTRSSEVVSKMNSEAITDVPLRIRLNADFNETYTIDSVRLACFLQPVMAGEFVKRVNGQLMLGNQPFRFAGANTYYFQPEIAYGNEAGVREVLNEMVVERMSVARTIGFNDHPSPSGNARCPGLSTTPSGNDPATIQFSPGVFCEANLRALDQAVAEAKRRNVRLILYLTNNFTAYGGIRRYVEWKLGRAPTNQEVNQFYTDATIRQWFKDYARMLLNRKNTVTDVLYKDEPAILAWELCNEPRNPAANAADRQRFANELQAWLREMSDYIKSIDTNHLISDGGEGFDDDASLYPGLSNTYAVRGDESASFHRTVALPNIDLASYHMYPASWGLNDTTDVEIWIREHEQLARAAGKVALLGEYGKRANNREPANCDRAAGRDFDAARAQLYDQWLEWAVCRYSTSGHLLWQLVYDQRPDCDGFAVYLPEDRQTVAVLRKYVAATEASAIAAVSAASYDGAMLAKDSIVAMFGSGLSQTTQVATALPLPTTIGGARVLIKDSAGMERASPLLFVSPAQINYLIPPDASTGWATVKVMREERTAACGGVMISAVAPGLFSADASGQGVASGVALRVKPNGSQSYEAIARFDPTQNKFVPIPIDLEPPDDQVFLIPFGTGFRMRSSLPAVTVTIGGSAMEVLFAGAVPGLAGLDQANVRLSPSLKGRGEVDAVMTVDGKAANVVRVSIK